MIFALIFAGYFIASLICHFLQQFRKKLFRCHKFINRQAIYDFLSGKSGHIFTNQDTRLLVQEKTRGER